MSMKPTHLIFGALAYMGYNMFAKTGAAKRLNFYISKVQATFSGVTPLVTLFVAVQNPTNQNFTMKSFAGNITANGYFIANVSNFSPVVIRPNSQAVIQMIARVSLIGVISDLFNAINSNSGLTQTVIFKGTLSVDTYVVPLELKYKIL